MQTQLQTELGFKFVFHSKDDKTVKSKVAAVEESSQMKPLTVDNQQNKAKKNNRKNKNVKNKDVPLIVENISTQNSKVQQNKVTQ